MFGFIRKKEEEFTLRLLAYQYKKQNIPLPDLETLRGQARLIVDQAHDVAKQRGRNILAIVKDLVRDFIKR